jgi:hypothetical protein
LKQKENIDSKYVKIVLNNRSLAFKSFAIILYNILLFVRGYTTLSLDEYFFNLIQHQVNLRNMGELPSPPPVPTIAPPDMNPIQRLLQPLLNMDGVRGKSQNPPKIKNAYATIVIKRGTPSHLHHSSTKELKNLQDKRSFYGIV